MLGVEGEALCAKLQIREVGLSWNLRVERQEMGWECQRQLPARLGGCAILIPLIPPSRDPGDRPGGWAGVGEPGGTSSVPQLREGADICRASSATNPGIFLFYIYIYIK